MIAQLVERIHGKDEVTGSTPVHGSKKYHNPPVIKITVDISSIRFTIVVFVGR